MKTSIFVRKSFLYRASAHQPGMGARGGGGAGRRSRKRREFASTQSAPFVLRQRNGRVVVLRRHGSAHLTPAPKVLEKKNRKEMNWKNGWERWRTGDWELGFEFVRWIRTRLSPLRPFKVQRENDLHHWILDCFWVCLQEIVRANLKHTI